MKKCFFLFVFITTVAVFASVPLCDMTASQRYEGEDGGLYGDGCNTPPPALMKKAQEVLQTIVPLDGTGENDEKNGKIVLVSISMSNATQEFSFFKRLADTSPVKGKSVTIVDCAQGGQTMQRWSSADAPAWGVAKERLMRAEITPAQVQVAWIKLANAGPTGSLWTHGRTLYDDTVKVLHNAKKIFPNLRIAYLGSRIYGGYARTPLNPEPYAYEGAFVVRLLIQNQMKGDPTLASDGKEPVAPLLLWGPYFWADGELPRKCDELVWTNDDFVADGTHPSPSGRDKVAQMLLQFFSDNDLARSWFRK